MGGWIFSWQWEGKVEGGDFDSAELSKSCGVEKTFLRA